MGGASSKAARGPVARGVGLGGSGGSGGRPTIASSSRALDKK